MKSLRQMILEKYPDFFKNLDPNLKVFAREIRKELRQEGHVVLGITGYPGKGKSNDTAILGALIDENYNFEDICFIPSSKEITERYMGFKMYSFFHVDEASRGLHKHKWYDKVQQTLNTLYDTEREGHFLCTALLMPRFQNFTENFRNFMITYWIHIPAKGLVVFYKKDEDKDTKDPWHLEENYKKKLKRWRNKRVFERSLSDVIGTEQITDCYWFYAQIPAIPKDIWAEYQKLKKESRTKVKEPEELQETPEERRLRKYDEKVAQCVALHNQGYKNIEIAAMLKIGDSSVSRYLRIGQAERKIGLNNHATSQPISNIYNQLMEPQIPNVKGGVNNTIEK